MKRTVMCAVTVKSACSQHTRNQHVHMSSLTHGFIYPFPRELHNETGYVSSKFYSQLYFFMALCSISTTFMFCIMEQ